MEVKNMFLDTLKPLEKVLYQKPATKYFDNCLPLGIASVHRKLNVTTSLSPETECTSCLHPRRQRTFSL